MGSEALFLNGVKSSEGFRPSDLTVWKDNYYLRLGNESDMDHPWKGSYYSVAIYNKALSQTEIITNYKTGPCDHIEDSDMDYSVDVFPNPLDDEGTLIITPEETHDIVPQTTLRIVDTYGRVMHQETIFNPNHQYIKSLDFTTYPQGVYFLQIVSGTKQKSAKLIVQHP
jgi:hypothetical protein